MNRLFLCLLLLCMFACDQTFGPPKDVLSEKTMISIMADLHVAEAKVKGLGVSQDSARNLFSIYEIQILDKHNVTPEKYLHSYQYYLDNHRLMTRVHQATLDTLIARQEKLESMPDSLYQLHKASRIFAPAEEEPAKADSVQNNESPADSGELILPQPVLQEEKTARPKRRKLTRQEQERQE
ncbi:DUF4296 domain-containing protein [Cesiribacter sp. SM1]|uniref:DUF4296 domain-containing protein n=1 Tax=Cesiribacter sp. SM1 TaxID=2861196 RepID=UPI001CD6840E|nr:DUF4296 domain-containing protein [Cesiribacter sp. SM1]